MTTQQKPKKLSLTDLQAILESLFFALSRPLSEKELLKAFQVEQIPLATLKQALLELSQKYQDKSFGIELKQVAGGWQIRTKTENKAYILRLLKTRPFQLSRPALEVLSIVAYRQPCKKNLVDEIRQVESSHLLKSLMEKGLISFGPKLEEPGRPLTYKTTPYFLEVFELKSVKDLPSLKEIQDLLSSEVKSPVDKENLNHLLNDLKSPSAIAGEQNRLSQELKHFSEQIDSIKTFKTDPKEIKLKTLTTDKEPLL